MKLALAGDTMLGRVVGENLRTRPPRSLVAEEVVEAAREADLFVLNLECCDAGIAWVGAGPDLASARTPVCREAAGHRLGVIGLSDHPEEYAAAPDRTGIAFAPLTYR